MKYICAKSAIFRILQNFLDFLKITILSTPTPKANSKKKLNKINSRVTVIELVMTWLMNGS